MNRAWITGGVIGLLALAVMVLVVMALRPADVDRPPVAPFEMGAIAVSGESTWRWVGPTNCNADANVVQLQRRTGDTGWVNTPIPLSNVYGISFADEQMGVATGTTKQCSRGVALTENGGRTWKYNPKNPVLLDAWFQGSTVWGIQRVIGTPQLAAFRVDQQLRLRPVPGFTPIRPCAAVDGVPVQVAFWSDEQGLLLCQNSVIGARLIARTTNGGANFEALNDDRATGGLDGVEQISKMVVVGEDSVWVLFGAGSDCPEGQLRYSRSQGATFTRLPCASKTVDVDEVLDMSFTSHDDGVLLGLRDRQPMMASTSDGGETWTELP